MSETYQDSQRLTASQAMRLLGVERSTFQKWVHAGLIKREVWGHRTYRYLVRDLKKLGRVQQ